MTELTPPEALQIIDLYTATFLFHFFFQIYALEIVLQLYVLLYSLYKYDDEGEPYRIIYLDILLAILMSIEIKSNYSSTRWRDFINNLSIQLDIMIATISFIVIGLLILHKENIIYLPEKYTETIHIFRDITRVLRIQVFARKLYTISKL